VDHCHDAVFIADATGKIEFVNAAFEALTGYSAEEAREGGLPVFLEGTSPANACENLLGEVLEKGFYRGPAFAVCKDRRRILLDLAMTVVRDYRMRTASVVCTGRDITDESELQAELRDARRMDTIGTVASGVVHDFNNLLMVIRAYAELGLQAIYCDHPLRRNLQEILSAAQRASELTRQLLASGRQAPGLHAVNLNSVVESACRLLARVLGEDVELRVSFGDGVGCINADPGQIEQMLLNLAVNARDAMPAGGTLSIETKPVSAARTGASGPGCADFAQHVLLEVADTGEGIPAQDVPKIFRPFYTTKVEGKGNGLGLAMVERTVKQSGGSIAVESEPSKGTTFRLYFPVIGHVREKSGTLATTECCFPRGSETVLVVEDDDKVRECNSDFLSSLGYRVLVAANGEEAIALAAQNPKEIDIMISDVIMPRLNGTKLASAMADSQPNMKVLLVSGHAHDVLRQKGLGAEVQVLQKPYSFGLLAERIRKELGPASRAHAAVAGAG
jgi:two-component system cell cycle sensor histidine kinase/response regulator CckA